MSKEKKNKLVDLVVNEVSLVFDGAIGETFSIIKSTDLQDLINERIVSVDDKWYVKDENGEIVSKAFKTQQEAVQELVQQYVNKSDKDDLVEKLKALDDESFVNIMRDMISRYNEINKGGQDNMDELKKMLEEFIDTTNSNLAKVNQCIDELQKSISMITEDVNKMKEGENKDELVNKMASFNDEIEKVSKSVEEITKSVEAVKKEVAEEVKKSLEEAKEAIKKFEELKLDEVIKNFSERLENLEKQANDSNSLEDDGNDSEVKKSQVFWKSILGVNE